MRTGPRSQRVWGWPIATYLFLGGLGGGSYLVGVLWELFAGSQDLASQMGISLGPPMVLLGSLFLFSDLGRPRRAWRVFLRPSTSWISRGALILVIFTVLGGIHMFFRIWPFQGSPGAALFGKMLGVVNGLFALATILYTDLVLRALRPIPLWSHPFLPFVFLFSGLTSGLFAVLLGISLGGLWVAGTQSLSGEVLSRWGVLLLLAQGGAVFFYFRGNHSPASRISIQRIVRGELSRLFWLGFVFCGLFFPLAAAAGGWFAGGEGGRSSLLVALLMAIPGLGGGYIWRYLIVSGGIRIPLQVEGGIVYPPPET